MTAQVLSFFQRSPRYAPQPADWSQQELAEFYRVEAALIRAGIRVGTDRGLSDENEPWFVFYRSDDGEVVIHFARIDGEYLIAGPAYEEIARGFDFTSLVRNLVAKHPLIKRPESGSNLSVHPAALLLAVVGTAFFKSGEARASETGQTNANSGHHRPTLLSSSSSAALGATPAQSAAAAGIESTQLPANQAVLILAAALLASDYRVETVITSADKREALSAAAAALGLNDSPIAPHASADAQPAAASSSVAVDPAPAATEMLSSVLSFVALLSTLPGQSNTAHTDTTQQLSTAVDHVTEPSSHAMEAIETANWALDIRLDPNNVGVVEAVQLVRGVVGSADMQKVSVIQVAKLPAVLAEIIAKGEHFVVPAPGAGATEAPAQGDQTPPPAQGSTGTDNTTLPQPQPQPDTTSDSGIPSTETPSAGPATPPAEIPHFSGFASMSLVRQFIDYFMAHTDSVQIVTEGLEVVIVDARVASAPSSIDHLTSVTFHFFDGSSVNIVGAQSAFLEHAGIYQ
jgi:hypothetical protein